MPTNFDLLEALQQMARDKGITVDTLFDALANALVAAYKRLPNAAEEAVVTIDPDAGEFRVYGQELDDDGNVIREWDDTPADFGRIAAQAAKQVLMQRVREAERDRKYEEYAGREGDIVTGIIQQTDSRFTLLDLGKVEALLPQAEQVPYERYDHGARLKAYIVEVRKTSKGPQIVVSRSHPGLIKRLFELEVPEISNGVVEIKACAREPGHRTKIAVWSNDTNVDPVGACVGARGARVRMVTTELRGEKVDIVPFSDDPAEFVARALQPAKVKDVLLDEERGHATVVVHDYQLSLAIGKEGQNARLAARLTGWHIDIRSESEIAAEEASYQQGEWAEGEWVENDGGEMVWKPAGGGETLSATQWAAGGSDSAEVEGDGARADAEEAAGAEAEPVAAGAEAEPVAAGADPEAPAGTGTVGEAVIEVEVLDVELLEPEPEAVIEAAEAVAAIDEEEVELDAAAGELEASAEDETDNPDAGDAVADAAAPAADPGDLLPPATGTADGTAEAEVPLGGTPAD